MTRSNSNYQAHRKEHLFSKVKEARELLKQEAETILRGYMTTIQMAVAAGDFEAALKAQQWLIDHLPGDEGVRLLDVSVDKVVQSDGPKGPQIQISVALGGLSKPQSQIQDTVIDITPSRQDVEDGTDRSSS